MIIAMEVSSLNVRHEDEILSSLARGAGREPVQPGLRPATRFANASLTARPPMSHAVPAMTPVAVAVATLGRRSC